MILKHQKVIDRNVCVEIFILSVSVRHNMNHSIITTYRQYSILKRDMKRELIVSLEAYAHAIIRSESKTDCNISIDSIRLNFDAVFD